MAARSQRRYYEGRRANRDNNGIRNNIYVYGNTARELDVREAIREKPKKKPSIAVRKNQEKAMRMNPAYVLFLTTALVVSSIILISYIRLQSEITNSINRIASLESELNALRLSNDEEYSRIESSVNLEEIKRIAIEELGMTYATEGQVVEYSSEGSDYVRQVADIPD
jgi:cell division protein FtsL